jgi:hypothetical protein
MLTRTQIEEQKAGYAAKMAEALNLANAFRGAVEALDWVLQQLPDEEEGNNDKKDAYDEG